MGAPKAWPGCLSRLERTKQPRGLTQRTPGTLSSKQTPALLQPRTCVPLPVVRGPRGRWTPGSRTLPREVKEGEGCLDTGASSNPGCLPAFSVEPPWEPQSPPTLPAVGRGEKGGGGVRYRVWSEGLPCHLFSRRSSHSLGVNWSRSPSGSPGERAGAGRPPAPL